MARTTSRSRGPAPDRSVGQSPRHLGPRARKRFGQHFLEPAWARKVVTAIDPRPDDFFIEVGPGRGAITRLLADRAAHVLAYELDRDLASSLVREAGPRVTVVQADFTALTAAGVSEAVRSTGVPHTRLRIAGNLPYNVGTVILGTIAAFNRTGLPFVDATVMLQREVADRLVAHPGTREYGVLTVLVAQWAAAERLLAVPPGAFRPIPSVHSAVVRLVCRPAPTAPRDQHQFEQVVRAIFGRRRKTLLNALKGLPHLRTGAEAILLAAHLDPRQRPETLSLEDLIELADIVGAGSGRGVESAGTTPADSR